MGTVKNKRLVACVAAAALLYAACSSGSASTSGSKARLAKISERWYIDELPPGRTTTALYHDAGKGPVLVDRAVGRYKVWANGVCVMYEAPRPEGQVIFCAAGRLTPIAVTTSDTLRPWRFDANALRRFDGPNEIEQRIVLGMEWIDYADVCNPAQMRPPRVDGWAKNVRVDPARFRVHESTLDVHGEDSVGNSVLSDAAREGQIAVVEELIRAGADVNSANRYGGSVLMTAIAYRHSDIVRLLLQSGAIVDAQDSDGETALMTAARYRNPEMAKILLDAGATATIRDNRGQTALAWVPDGDAAPLRELRTLLQRAEDAAR